MFVGACASAPPRFGVPDGKLAIKAEIAGLPGIRAWADEATDDPVREIARRTPNMPKLGRSTKTSKSRPIVETLALSGGGADGAFGAGVLKGWTERGDRPEFEVVTGVSAGAIIAPFAFLGPAYDDKLETIWTKYRASDVVTAQLLPGLLGGEALADTSPMAKLIAEYIDAETMRAIAAEYQRGRILMVLTTNLDAQRPVVWNMGEIAHAGTPEALDLFRKVILASAAIPGAFPPVRIPVTVNGKRYEELHVDGGTTREVFVLPVQAPFSAFDKLYPRPPDRRVYVIKNGKITPEYEIVEPKTLTIAARSISTLIKSQNWGELYRIRRMAADDNVAFNFLSIPESFSFTTTEIYDPKYQRALFEIGREAGLAHDWLDAPPGQTSIPGKKPRARNRRAIKTTPTKSPAAKPPAPPEKRPEKKPAAKPEAPLTAPDGWTPQYAPPLSPSAQDTDSNAVTTGAL